MERKFTISLTDIVNNKNITITINTPKNGITVEEVQSLQEAYDELYSVSTTLKRAKYIDTSDTVVYPATA